MSIRERSKRRDKDMRQLLELESPMNVPEVKNSFSTDKNLLEMLNPEQRANLLDQLLATVPQGREIDLSKPVVAAYRHQAFPKIMYDHDNGLMFTVADDKQMKAAEKDGYQAKPSPDFDYSKVVGNKAARKAS